MSGSQRTECEVTDVRKRSFLFWSSSTKLLKSVERDKATPWLIVQYYHGFKTIPRKYFQIPETNGIVPGVDENFSEFHLMNSLLHCNKVVLRSRLFAGEEANRIDVKMGTQKDKLMLFKNWSFVMHLPGIISFKNITSIIAGFV